MNFTRTRKHPLIMSRKIKILLVEDNEDERIFMKEGFNSTGLYEVVAEAGNGEEMLQLFKEPSFSMPEMVLSDLNMPGKNGYEVIKDVRSYYSRPNLPVVILSSAPCVPYAERCKQIGASSFFTQPDTFLEYEDFAKSIYSQLLNNCLKEA